MKLATFAKRKIETNETIVEHLLEDLNTAAGTSSYDEPKIYRYDEIMNSSGTPPEFTSLPSYLQHNKKIQNKYLEYGWYCPLKIMSSKSVTIACKKYHIMDKEYTPNKLMNDPDFIFDCLRYGLTIKDEYSKYRLYKAGNKVRDNKALIYRIIDELPNYKLLFHEIIENDSNRLFADEKILFRLFQDNKEMDKNHFKKIMKYNPSMEIIKEMVRYFPPMYMKLDDKLVVKEELFLIFLQNTSKQPTKCQINSSLFKTISHDIDYNNDRRLMVELSKSVCVFDFWKLAAWDIGAFPFKDDLEIVMNLVKTYKFCDQQIPWDPFNIEHFFQEQSILKGKPYDFILRIIEEAKVDPYKFGYEFKIINQEQGMQLLKLYIDNDIYMNDRKLFGEIVCNREMYMFYIDGISKRKYIDIDYSGTFEILFRKNMFDRNDLKEMIKKVGDIHVYLSSLSKELFMDVDLMYTALFESKHPANKVDMRMRIKDLSDTPFQFSKEDIQDPMMMKKCMILDVVKKTDVFSELYQELLAVYYNPNGNYAKKVVREAVEQSLVQ